MRNIAWIHFKLHYTIYNILIQVHCTETRKTVENSNAIRTIKYKVGVIFLFLHLNLNLKHAKCGKETHTPYNEITHAIFELIFIRWNYNGFLNFKQSGKTFWNEW
jgi:hypothetical protein